MFSLLYISDKTKQFYILSLRSILAWVIWRQKVLAVIVQCFHKPAVSRQSLRWGTSIMIGLISSCISSASRSQPFARPFFTPKLKPRMQYIPVWLVGTRNRDKKRNHSLFLHSHLTLYSFIIYFIGIIFWFWPLLWKEALCWVLLRLLSGFNLLF